MTTATPSLPYKDAKDLEGLSLTELNAEWRTFTEFRGLPHISADELHAELLGTPGADEDAAWCLAFSRAVEAAEEAEREARPSA